MNDHIRIESPNFKRTEPLTQQQRIALIAAVRDVIQRETSSPREACAIALAVTATFCMDLTADNIEEMAKQLQKIKNGIVSDFRSGQLRMQRSQVRS